MAGCLTSCGQLISQRLHWVSLEGLSCVQVRNWMFTTFYVGAEMWGDVVLSLLFWGLANEMTTMGEAPLLYPLFGIGANIGQTVSGKALSTFSTFSSSRLSYATQLQARPSVAVADTADALFLCGALQEKKPAEAHVPAPRLWWT